MKSTAQVVEAPNNIQQGGEGDRGVEGHEHAD